MDPKEAYILMSKRFYDSENRQTFIPPKLEKYFDSLKPHDNKYKYNYQNLEELFDRSIDIFVDACPKDETSEKFILQLNNGSNITFNIEALNDRGVENKLIFTVRKKKGNEKNICVQFEIYPFLNFTYINSLFYDTGDKKKINANRDCEVFDIPEKSGEFFINLIEDISRRFGVKQIILQDASTIVYEGSKINLALFYLQKNGKTYYGKFDFLPIKKKEPNAKILFDIAFGIKFLSAKEDLDYVKNKLKEIKNLKPATLVSWIKKTNPLKIYFPQYYLKKIK